MADKSTLKELVIRKPGDGTEGTIEVSSKHTGEIKSIIYPDRIDTGDLISKSVKIITNGYRLNEDGTFDVDSSKEASIEFNHGVLEDGGSEVKAQIKHVYDDSIGFKTNFTITDDIIVEGDIYTKIGDNDPINIKDYFTDNTPVSFFYFGADAPTRDSHPNVLFWFDTSNDGVTLLKLYDERLGNALETDNWQTISNVYM